MTASFFAQSADIRPAHDHPGSAASEAPCPVRQCEQCGKDIASTNRRKRFCDSACWEKSRRARKLDYMREYQRKWCKAQRLAIAAAIAPALRKTPSSRPVNLVDVAGNVVRKVSTKTLVKTLSARAGIELQSDDGKDRRSVCELCGVLFVRPGRSRKPVCLACRAPRCACGSATSKSGAYRARLHGEKPRCIPCYRKSRIGKPIKKTGHLDPKRVAEAHARWDRREKAVP